MQFKKHLKSPLAALAIAGTLAGCVTLQWMVKYQDADKYYSTGNAAAIDSQGNAFMGGYVEPRGADINGRISFVAKYDPKGNMLWDYRFTDSLGVNLRGVNNLITDDAGNVYITEVRYVFRPYFTHVLVTKLDSSGNRVWQSQKEILAVIPNEIKTQIRPDGNVYISSILASSDLVELSPAGDELWTINSAAPLPSHGELGAFATGVDVASFSENNLASLRNLGTGLQLLGPTGEILATFQGPDLGLGEISQAFVQDGAAVVVGTSSNGWAAQKIVYTGSSFVVDSSNRITLGASQINASPSAAGGFCFLVKEAGKAVSTGYVDKNLTLKWKNTTQAEADIADVEAVDVEATDSRCYSEFYTYKTNKATSIVLVNDIATGKARQSVTTPDFATNDLAVKDDIVVQAGITGPYTTEDGTAATLTRHKVD